MTAIASCLRAGARRRLAALGMLALLTGLSAGAVMATAAGARRTDSAYERFLDATHAPQVTLPIFPWLPIARFDEDKVRALPGVSAVERIALFMQRENEPSLGVGPGMLDDLTVLSGRAPDPARPDEVIAGFDTAERHGIALGDTLVVTLGVGEKPAERVSVRVVGIGAWPDNFPPVEEGFASVASMRGTPAFVRAHARADHLDFLNVHLRDGDAGLPAFERALARSLGPTGFFILRERDHAANVKNSIHLQAVAMWLLAGLIAACVALIFSQSIARMMYLASSEHPSLRAIGMTRAQLFMLGIVSASVIGAVACAVAVATMIALSPLAPVGLARIAEPTPGVHVDTGVMFVGLALTFGATLLLAAWPAWRASRVGASTPVAHSRSRVFAGFLGRRGFSPAAVSGVRLALEPGRGSSAVPVRTTIATVALGVASLAVASSFVASLDHLSTTPRLHGFNWDTTFFLAEGPPPGLTDELRADRRIAAFSLSASGIPVSVGDVPVLAMAVRGTVTPPLLEGRAPGGPEADREVVLGTKTMRAAHVHVGDRIRIAVQGAPERGFSMDVVGRAVFPSFSSSQGLGKGVLLTLGAAHALLPEQAEESTSLELMVRFAPGIDAQATFAEYRDRLDHDANNDKPKPREIVDFGKVDAMPHIMAGGLALLAALTMAHTLVSSVRRRRRDLAVLKTLGFVRRQIARAVSWQAATIAVLSVAIGLPLGVIAGRIAWVRFADELGFVAEPRVPPLAVALIAPIAVVLAVAIAAFPGRLAARAQPATELRAE